MVEHYDLYRYDRHEWEFVTTYTCTYADDHWSAVDSSRTTFIENGTRAAVLNDAIKHSILDWRGYMFKVYRSRDQKQFVCDPNPDSLYDHPNKPDTMFRVSMVESKVAHTINDVLIIQPDYPDHALFRLCMWIA